MPHLKSCPLYDGHTHKLIAKENMPVSGAAVSVALSPTRIQEWILPIQVCISKVKSKIATVSGWGLLDICRVIQI